LLIVFFVLFIPLASRNPDGLEKVAQTYGADEKSNLWNGLFADYSIAIIGNQYLSTLIAGLFGTLMVLVVGLVFGKISFKKRSSPS
jgi:hypothetical protein